MQGIHDRTWRFTYTYTSSKFALGLGVHSVWSIRSHVGCTKEVLIMPRCYNVYLRYNFNLCKFCKCTRQIIHKVLVVFLPLSPYWIIMKRVIYKCFRWIFIPYVNHIHPYLIWEGKYYRLKTLKVDHYATHNGAEVEFVGGSSCGCFFRFWL